MKYLRYTLITDGTSDRVFLPILNWLLIDLEVNIAIQPEWADLGRLPNPPKSLADRIDVALELYPCDLLFIHRDAESQSRQKRVDEIEQSIRQSKIEEIPIVFVIPIRMLEAWLLFDEVAIRRAASNPNGNSRVKLPNLGQVEKLPDPKKTLCQALENASGLTGRRLKKFKERQAIHRLAEIIDDFSPLYQLSAFQALKEELGKTLDNQGWLG